MKTKIATIIGVVAFVTASVNAAVIITIADPVPEPAIVDLTALGSLDWQAWPGGVFYEKDNATTIGVATFGSFTQIYSGSTTFNWTDAQLPNAQGSASGSSQGGIYADGGAAAFSIPITFAANTTYTINFFVGQYNAGNATLAVTGMASASKNFTGVPGGSYLDFVITASTGATDTGSLTFWWFSDNGFPSVDAITVSAVPEPSTLSAFGLGIMGVALNLLRRQRFNFRPARSH